MAEDTNQGTNTERNSAGALNDPYSRRLFLRAAVIGTAGVAGAAGVAGVALARSGKSPSVLGHVFNSSNTPSSPPSGHMGFEDTGLDGCTSSYGGSGNSGLSRYLIFYAANLPAGSYSFDATEKINLGPTNELGTDPWDFQGAEPVHIEVVAAGHGTACPSSLSKSATPKAGLPATFTLGAKSDVIIFMHLDYNGTPTKGDTTVFTGNLTGTVSVTATETVTAA